jgi:hypothetical protein
MAAAAADVSTSTARKLQEIVSPVPPDYVIAQSVKPLNIEEVAKAVGLEPEDYDLYGKMKAKVRFRKHCEALEPVRWTLCCIVSIFSSVRWLIFRRGDN